LKVICELKAVDGFNPTFQAQLLSYLRMIQIRLGFLINFNVPLIIKGIKRIILLFLGPLGLGGFLPKLGEEFVEGLAQERLQERMLSHCVYVIADHLLQTIIDALIRFRKS
jgi:hypothetical protein